jgi:ABC-type sugar transport system substrate-binding protein
MKRSAYALLALPFLLLSSCNKSPENNAPPTGTPQQAYGDKPQDKKLKIGYVLHGLNDFTQVIKRGAEDAGKALGVEVEVQGPSKFEANQAIGMFQAFAQKGVDGLVVIPMPGDVWVKPIKDGVDAKIPVVTANMTSNGSASASWFGQDEYQSGVILAQEMRKLLEKEGKTSGQILAGICKPGEMVLEERYKGFKEGIKGSGFEVTDAKDVGTENTANYSAWENQATAHPEMIAAVGLCSMDVPNLSKLKSRTGGKWLVGGYDLNAETLDALKAGTAQVSLGQHPYLQGYLPVLALVQHLRDKKPLPAGWVNVGTEIVTKDNVETVYPRETDRAAETKWYADHVAKNFSDLGAMAKPLPKAH